MTDRTPRISRDDPLQPATHGQADARMWQQLADAFADTPSLAAEITRLRADLAGIRLDRANLAAAALAAITAYQDGDADPLSYLKDELHVQGYNLPRGSR